MTPAQLQIVISAVNNAQTALQQAADQVAAIGTNATTAAPSVSQLFSTLQSAAGTAAADLAPVTAAIAGVAGVTVVSATSLQTATAQGNAYIQSTLTQATASGQNSQAIADLNSQIATQQAKISTANAQMQDWSGTTATVAARHQAAAAAIQAAQIQITALQGQLEPLVNVTQLAGVSAASVESQFNTLANSGETLGFSFEDSYVSLGKLFATFKSMPEAMSAYQAAQGLALQAGISLPQATQEIMQAQATGTGRQIGQQLGISIKDGLSGTNLIEAILSATSSSIPDIGNTVGVKVNEAIVTSQHAAATLGSTTQGPLATILQDYSNLAVGATDWMTQHQTAADAIEGTLLTIAGILTALVSLAGIVKVIGLAVEGFQALWIMFSTGWTLLTMVATTFGNMAAFAWSAFAAGVEFVADAFVALAVALGLSVGWLAIIIIVIAAVAVAIVLYHKQILDAIELCWNTAVNFLANIELNIYNTLVSWGTGLVNWWQGLWNGIFNFLDSIIGKIQGVISGLLSSIQKITSGISGVFSGVGGALGPLAPLLAGGLTMLASGGIVNSPTLALVGENGPEAVIPLSAFNGGNTLAGAGGIGGGGGITININGGSYLNQGGAQQIAQALATMIGRQLKLTTV
jgi:hypothetical protein